MQLILLVFRTLHHASQVRHKSLVEQGGSVLRWRLKFKQRLFQLVAVRIHLEFGVALIISLAEEASFIVIISVWVKVLFIVILIILLFNQILLVCSRCHILALKQAILSFRLVRGAHRAVPKLARGAGRAPHLLIAALSGAQDCH